MPRIANEAISPALANIYIAIFACLAFALAAWVLRKTRFSLFWIILFGLVLILASNYVQGWQYGFVRPIDGAPTNRNQYYQDAISQVSGPIKFLSSFTSLQPELHQHAVTHPPGAVLVIFILNSLLQNLGVGYISVAIAIIATVLTAFSIRKLLLTEFDIEKSGFLTFLLLLVPAIQIYFAASLDALITSCFMCALVFFVDKKWRFSIVPAVIFLFASSFLTYLFLFLLPVFAGYEWVVNRSFKRTLIVVLSLVVIYWIIYAFTRFNYITAFIYSTAYENSHGFALITAPVNYFATRLEGIAEIFLFYGPFLTVAALCGFRWPEKGQKLMIISWLGIFTIILLFLAGLFRTGETARIAMFIYPFLLVPVGYYVKKLDLTFSNLTLLISLVFAQTIIMQMIGNYFW